MELERENKRLKVLIVILLVFLVAFGGNYFYEKVVLVNKSGETTGNDVLVNKEKEYNKEELLTLLDGIWYSCSENSLGNLMCYVSHFHDNRFEGGQYGAGGGYGGEIKFISLIEENKYVFVTYSPGCHGNNCMDETEEKYETFVVDITNISNKIIIINGVEIKYADKDIEAAHKIIDNILYN